MSEPAADPAPGRPFRLAIEVLPAVALLVLMVWDVRAAMTPLVVFPLLVFTLWPARATPMGRHSLTAVSLIFACWIIGEIGSVLAPFVLAFGIAYLLAPAVAALVKRGVPRGLAIPLVVLPFLAVLVGLVLLLVPQIEHQLLDVASRLPDLVKRSVDWALALRQRFLETGGAGFLTDAQIQRLQSLQPSDLAQLVSGKWDAIAANLWTAMLGVGKGVGMGLAVVLTVLGYVVVAPVVTFYLLGAWPSLMQHLTDMIPPARRPEILGFLKEYDHALGRFVRGQLLEATLVGTLTAIGLALFGFPAAILMGVVAALCNLIPTVGLFLGLIPGVLIALTAPAPGAALLQLLVVYAVVQIMDGQITGPRIVGGSVGLSPVWMMIAVLVFGSLFGFIGLFLAVPLAALVKMIVVRAFHRYEHSPAYAGETAT